MQKRSNEDNNNKNMFRCRYGQQVDFDSDNADIQKMTIQLFIRSVINKKVVEVIIKFMEA